MAWVPGVGHVPGAPGVVMPAAAVPGFHPYWQAGVIEAANSAAVWQAQAQAVAMAQAQATAQAIAMAQATAAAQAQAAAMAAASSRPAIVNSVQTHLAAVAPAVATNPDAAGHVAAASQLVAQLAV